MNKTLPNPYYLFSFQHIASKERVSFYPQVITSNVRYDKFRFVEAPTTNLSATPPQVFFEYLGQYYYSIYENITSGSTDIALAYNKLESGRAWVIVGDDNTQECFFEPYISNDEDFAQVIYVSEQEEACIYPTPSITPSLTSTPIPASPTPTPSITPTITPTITPSTTPPTPYDPDALTYLSAVSANGGTLDATISAATNTLFTDLKSNGLYNKIKIMYPYLGGVANSNKLNAKNPNGAYDLNFVGSFTHNYSGSSANNDVSYASTNYFASSPTDNLNSNHFSLYIGTTGRTYTGGAVYIMEFGNMDALYNTNFFGVLLGVEYIVDGGQSYFGNMTSSLVVINQATMSASTGFIGSSRTSTSNWFAYKNNTQIATDSSNRTQNFPTNSLGNPLYVPAFAGNIISSQRRHQFATFGDGLTTGEMSTLQNIINTFQTSIGRNLY